MLDTTYNNHLNVRDALAPKDHGMINEILMEDPAWHRNRFISEFDKTQLGMFMIMYGKWSYIELCFFVDDKAEEKTFWSQTWTDLYKTYQFLIDYFKLFYMHVLD